MASTPRTRASNPPKRPMTIIEAHRAGISSADEWLEKSVDSTVTVPPACAWRALALAEFVQQHQHRTDLPQLVPEWQSGFDVRLEEAEAYSRATPAPTLTSTLSRIHTDANTVVALLSVAELLPEAGPALVACARISRDVTSRLDQLVGGAS